MLDRVLDQAIRFWAKRPSPVQRAERIGLGEALCTLKKGLGDEEFGLLFPEAKRAYDDLMSLARY